MKSTKLKTDKGITLIALIITIVVLMILAAVAINSITNEGIISKAESVKDKYEQEQIKEKDMLDYYEELLAGTLKYVKDVQGQLLSATKNTNVYDEYGNRIVLPAGFKITTDADTVEEGIVIEDCTETATKGSQFVWIPVGKVNSSEGTKTITLGRYVFDSNGIIDQTLSKTNPKDQLKELSASTDYYTEGLKNDITPNAHARDIEAFITSANTKGGYYIGRYEARDNSGTVTTVATHTVWNSVNQATASSESRDMYRDGYTTGTFSSDLINSYAWDTAIVFIQAFEDNDYSMQTSLNDGAIVEEKGTQGLEASKQDEVCNIWDMASNCFEWSTETYNSYDYYVSRGDTSPYPNNQWHSSSRNNYKNAPADYTIHSFRPILYVAL